MKYAAILVFFFETRLEKIYICLKTFIGHRRTFQGVKEKNRTRLISFLGLTLFEIKEKERVSFFRLFRYFIIVIYITILYILVM